jgi:hypothetical protein
MRVTFFVIEYMRQMLSASNGRLESNAMVPALG